MVDPLTLGAYAQIASGFTLLLVGAGLVYVRPRRAYTVAFGLFLVVWSGMILFGNLATLALTDGALDQAQAWIHVHLAFLVVAYLPLVYFALRFPGGSATGPRPAAALGLTLPAIAGAVILNADPGLLHAGFRGTTGAALSDWGPAFPVYSALFSVALYVVILRLDRHRRDATSLVDRRRTAYVLSAFLLYQLFEDAETLLLLGADALATGAIAGTSLAFTAVSIVGLGIGAYAVAGLARDPHEPLPLSGGPLALAFLAPAGFGVLSGLSRVVPALPPMLTLGLWRLAAVALIAYALLRFELFGVRSRRADWIAMAGAGGLLLALGLGAEALLAGLIGSDVVASALVYGSLFVGLAALLRYRPSPVDRMVTSLARRPGTVAASPRALEVYEAELARWSAGPAEPDTPTDLADIGDALAIDPAEHAALAGLVRRETADAIAPVEPGDRLENRYELGARIGSGARSVVHEAKDAREGRSVAIKLLAPDGAPTGQAVRAFLREARMARGLDHPNVVDVLDTGFDRGRPFLVLELVRGGSLAARLDEHGSLDSDETIRLADAILAGLAHLHGRGLVHGDLKPTNLLLTERGTPKIADLGTVRRFDPDQTQALDDAPAGAGTPLYMPPEVLDGRTPGRRADLYAVGAILHEALTGEHYLGLADADRARLHRAIRARHPRPLPEDVPEPLRSAIQRSLAKRPWDRFASAGEMRAALPAAAEPTPPRDAPGDQHGSDDQHGSGATEDAREGGEG